jgi:hypothetical protein
MCLKKCSMIILQPVKRWTMNIFGNQPFLSGSIEAHRGLVPRPWHVGGGAGAGAGAG